MSISAKMDLTDVKRKFNGIKKNLDNMTQPYDEMGDELIEFYGDENFDAQGAKLGTKWKSLSPFTLQARARRTGHYKKSPTQTGKILIWTGALQKGFRKGVTAVRLTIDNTVSYFKFNNKDRPMLKINARVIEIIETVMNKFLIKITK